MSILDLKCATDGCWHYVWRGYTFCSCCIHGHCYVMTPAERTKWMATKEESVAMKKEAERRLAAGHL